MMIAAMHPDICRVTREFGRIHHYANYKKFIHLKPILKSGLKIRDEIDNYGMELKELA
jgi:hypothetical protein